MERGIPELDGQVSAPRHRRRRLVLALALGFAAIVAVALVFALPGSRTLTAFSDSVGVIDTAAGALTAVVQTGGQPGGIAVGEGAVWETDTANAQLLMINPRTRAVERIAVGRGPRGVVVGGGEVWVVNQLDRTVSEINPRALRPVASFRVGNGADAVASASGRCGSLTSSTTRSRGSTRARAESRRFHSPVSRAGSRPAGMAYG